MQKSTGYERKQDGDDGQVKWVLYNLCVLIEWHYRFLGLN